MPNSVFKFPCLTSEGNTDPVTHENLMTGLIDQCLKID
nr:MAG TPA: hypothetical protein [Caudoviricetes sp.]